MTMRTCVLHFVPTSTALLSIKKNEVPLYPCQEANLRPWYCLTCLLPLTPWIIQLFSCLQTSFGVGGSVLKWFTSY